MKKKGFDTSARNTISFKEKMEIIIHIKKE